jgi:hypothetical protein
LGARAGRSADRSSPDTHASDGIASRRLSLEPLSAVFRAICSSIKNTGPFFDDLGLGKMP